MNARTQSRFGTPELLFGLSVAVLPLSSRTMLLIFFNAFWVDGRFNIADVIKVLREKDTYQALLNSLILVTGVTVTGTIVGTFFAWLVTRTDLPFKGTMKVLFLDRFMLPAFIGALAWKMLLSPRSGYINRFFIDVLGFSGPVFDIYTYVGIILVETMYLFPFVFIQVSGALERMDPTLEESARISGADLFTITRKITIPLVMPSILSGALLIMLYSMAHFGTVAMLGMENGIYNIPTLIYEKIHQSAGSFKAIRTGTVLATVLVAAAALILWLQNRLLSRGRYQIIGGKSFRPSELKLRGLRILLVFCIVYIGYHRAADGDDLPGRRPQDLRAAVRRRELTWHNYHHILFEWDLTRGAIFNSISLGLAAALITMFAGVIISYVIVKMRVRGKGMLEFLGMLPFSVPGSVIALGVILAWSGKFGVNLYNTVWIILVAYIARYMAFSLKANSAALEQVHNLVEARAWVQRWRRRSGHCRTLGAAGDGGLLPDLLPALRELTVSVLLYGPTTRTIGVAIYTLNEDGETVYSAALAGIALIIIVLGELLIKRLVSGKNGA
jgi:iron(III) transport system permease protein